jgi:hypothetical protein
MCRGDAFDQAAATLLTHEPTVNSHEATKHTTLTKSEECAFFVFVVARDRRVDAADAERWQ